RGPAGSRAIRVLLAARHRRGVPARVYVSGSGRAAVRAARVVEEPGDGYRSPDRDNARSSNADDVHTNATVQVRLPSPDVAREHAAGWHVPCRREAPHQSLPAPDL